MAAKFFAVPESRRVEPNGSLRYSSAGGHLAKVEHCPIVGQHVRLTCYATGVGEPVPAYTRIRGVYTRGHFVDGPAFRPIPEHEEHFR